MTLVIDNTFNLNGTVSNFCMRIAGTTTTAVLARIRVRPTAERAGPPACGNGFDTARLAFAKGHVIALELGGSDHPANVVPQFEHWQGKANGAWRQMEIALKAYKDHVMLVEIAYGRTGGEQDHDTMLAAFVADRLMDWTDSRIPDGFKVYIWNDKTRDPDKIADENAFNLEIIRLKTLHPVFTKDFALGNAMPEPDRGGYVVQTGITIFNGLYEAYLGGGSDDKGGEEKELKSNSNASSSSSPSPSPTLQRKLSKASFLLQKQAIEDIRSRLKVTDSVTQTEAAGLQLLPVIRGMQWITPKALETKRSALKRTRPDLAIVGKKDLADPKKGKLGQ